VGVTCWWAGVDEAHCTGKFSGVESSHLVRTHPTSQVHAVLGGSKLVSYSFVKYAQQ
jgi:hypothetical protein